MGNVPVEFWLAVFGMLGAILGSYVNMASYRLPRNISTVTRTRSFCPSCQHQLAWFDNIPILSYTLLGGRCRYCRKPIGSRYFWVEIIVAGLFVAAAYQFLVLNPPLTWAMPFSGTMPPIRFAALLFLIVDLVLLSVVDLECWLIPFETTLWWIPAAVIVAIFFPELHGAATSWTGSPAINALIDSVEGAILGAGVPWTIGFLTTVYTFYLYRLRGSNERPLEGMGAGDCHLLALVGAVLGWKDVLITILLGCFIGALTGIAKILWDNFQQWRLKDKWRPWQPTFDLPEDGFDKPPTPASFMSLLIFGLNVLIFAGVLYGLSVNTWKSGIFPTLEERPLGFLATGNVYVFDVRLVSVALLGLLGVLLVWAWIFLRYLARIDRLPQGNIVENDKGEKQEVITVGHYVPFGPSLALAALIVAFYDPLIRNFLYWWFAQGSSGNMPPLPYRVIGQKEILAVLAAIVAAFDALTLKILGGR